MVERDFPTPFVPLGFLMHFDEPKPFAMAEESAGLFYFWYRLKKADVNEVFKQAFTPDPSMIDSLDIVAATIEDELTEEFLEREGDNLAVERAARFFVNEKAEKLADFIITHPVDRDMTIGFDVALTILKTNREAADRFMDRYIEKCAELPLSASLGSFAQEYGLTEEKKAVLKRSFIDHRKQVYKIIREHGNLHAGDREPRTPYPTHPSTSEMKVRS